MFTLKLLMKCGLVLPAIYALIGFGLWLAKNEIMIVGSTNFILFHIGFILLTLVCIWRAIKSALGRRREKTNEIEEK